MESSGRGCSSGLQAKQDLSRSMPDGRKVVVGILSSVSDSLKGRIFSSKAKQCHGRMAGKKVFSKGVHANSP
jgi:hypothetical protein